MNSKIKFFCIVLVFCLISSPVFSQAFEQLMVKAHRENDPEVKKAISLLAEKGYLKNDIQESFSSSFRGPNCIFILKEKALRGSFIHALTDSSLSKIKKLDVKFVHDAIHVSGKIKVLFSTKNFSVNIRLESDENNVVDFVLTKVKLSGLNLKFFSGLIFKLIKNRMRNTFGEAVDFTDLGKNSQGNRILRARIWPNFFFPRFGSPGNLNAMRIYGDEFQILVTLE